MSDTPATTDVLRALCAVLRALERALDRSDLLPCLEAQLRAARPGR